MDAWVVEVLRVGYRIPFHRQPPLSERPLSLPAYSPQSIKGVALTLELQHLLQKGAVELAPQSPGFYSRLFLVQKASGSWRPIIDLSTLNGYVTSSHFHMETPQSVLRSIRPGDWMVSLDLQDAYLQVPVHHDSCRYLRFVVEGRTYQFRVLCFSLTTAPQVFTRIMAPVSAILHKYGVRMLRYLEDWLILASSELACLQSRDRLLTVCTELGIQVNLTKSSLVPTQSLVYLGMEIRSLPFIARPAPARVSNLLRMIEEFLSTPSPPASLWCRLLGHLSSLTLLVPGGMLRMRLLQLCLKDQWDFLDDQFQVSWSPLCQEDLLWWARVAQRREGVSLSLPAPDVSFFSDTSDVGWGALVGEHHASGLWSPLQTALSINLRELLAVQYGLRALEHLLVGRSVALFCDNTTTVAYLRRSGGTFSSTLNDTAREILLWAETNRVRLLPQFIMGSSNVTADILSRPNQVIGSEWTLHQEVVDHLVHKWLAVIDLFATSLTARLPVYFSPASDSRAAGADALLQPWDNLQAYAFPAIAIIRRVLVKLRSSRNCELTLIVPFWPQREWFPDLLELLSDVPIALSSRKDLLRQPHFHRFHQNLPMLQLTAWRLSSDSPISSTVAGQLVFCRRQSTRLNYQARWGTYRKWCRDFGHRSSSPSISKIAEFFTYLFKRKGAALSTIKGYRAMLLAIFKFPLPEISTSILKDLIRPFEISAPRPLFPPPPLDLDKVLQYLSGPPFEPLARASFLDKTKKALFLLAMATAKWVSELQAPSFFVSFQGEDLVLYYDPFFRAKTESAANPLPRSVIVPSLSDFAGDLPERVQCPVRAIKFLRKAARSASYIPSRLFVSPRNPKRAMSKNAISLYLRQLITDSGAVSTSRPPRAHDIRGIATSLNYYSNLSLSNLMQVATWKSNRVFASRYLKEVSATQDNIRRFGPLVIAGDRLHPRPPQHKH